MARRKKGRGGARRRRRGVAGGGMRIASARDKGYIVAGAAVYGYFANHVDFAKSLPVLAAIGGPLSHGVLLHLGAQMTSGEIRRWLDLASVGALAVGGYNIGRAKGDLAAAAKMQGVDAPGMLGHHDEVMGELDDDDVVEGEDEAYLEGEDADADIDEDVYDAAA